MKARILWIEGKRANGPLFIPSLRKKEYRVEVVATGSAAIEILADLDPDLVVINAASMRSNGKRICRELRTKIESLPIVVILDEGQTLSGEPCANVVLNLPFTSRKLMNRIIPLLPSDEKNLLFAGPIRLDLQNHKVRCQGREARLTPRLVNLLQALMEHPGEVAERASLFCRVWNTEYTGDTRTLDVHISWLRQAIEEDPRKPRFLKTIRGMGYRLDT